MWKDIELLENVREAGPFEVMEMPDGGILIEPTLPRWFCRENKEGRTSLDNEERILTISDVLRRLLRSSRFIDSM